LQLLKNEFSRDHLVKDFPDYTCMGVNLQARNLRAV
jgi:hypothetical protein